MRLTGHSLINRSQSHFTQVRRLRRSVVFILVLLPALLGPPCSGEGESTPALVKGKGRVTIVYQDDAIQLNYGWWTVLEPYLTDSCKKETKAARQQPRKDLEDENKALPAKLKQVRGGQ